VVLSLGFDPIWFGVVAVLMMEAGLITPPVGLNVYTLAGIARDVPMADIFRGVMPFLLGIFVLVFLLTLFPQLVTFLPNMMGR
jgi:TRAP-type C4-dicarboxylate transport system permease large subunit